MKRIIICCDGTWNQPDQTDRGKRKPSNVIKMVRGIKPIADDDTVQVVYYQLGVGTGRGADKWLGGGTGLGLSENIIESYRFLANNFVSGDQVYLFGFSRGAYTARSLVGLIDTAGLLPKNEIFFMKEAYELYRSQPQGGNEADEEAFRERTMVFREKHLSQSIPIQFLGVWDTVGALGIPIGLFSGLNKRYAFHKVRLSSSLVSAYQALAIDERRKVFRPALWSPETPRPIKYFEQRWFAGVHSNIGGGYENDGLSNIPLHWLKDKASDLGLEYDNAFLNYYRPYYKDELRKTMKGKYRFLGKYGRPIGEAVNGNETVDSTAIDRLRKKFKGYSPVNLITFCKRSRIDIE